MASYTHSPSTDDFIVKKSKKKTKSNNSFVIHQKQSTPVKPDELKYVNHSSATGLNCIGNQNNTKTYKPSYNNIPDDEQLRISRANDTPFEININSSLKQIVRDVCGLHTDHNAWTTQHSTTQKSNDKIMSIITTQLNRKYSNSISFALFCCQAAVKIDNPKLLLMIKDVIIKRYGLTFTEIINAVYQNGSNLVNAAAWNCSMPCLRVCVANGANLNFTNGYGETALVVMKKGRDNLIKLDPASKKIIDANYEECRQYFIDAQQRTINNPNSTADLSPIKETSFKFSSKKKDDKEKEDDKTVKTDDKEKTEDDKAVKAIKTEDDKVVKTDDKEKDDNKVDKDIIIDKNEVNIIISKQICLIVDMLINNTNVDEIKKFISDFKSINSKQICDELDNVMIKEELVF